MMKIERILCPVDLSSGSDKALRYAVALARAYRAKLFVCYCAEEIAPADTFTRGEAREEIKKVVEGSLALHVEGGDIASLNWESVVIEGRDPAEAITHEAAARAIDLIVMCSRRRPLRAALLGSTAESVYRTAPCPVLITHPDQREWMDASTGVADLKRVLVAQDFSDYSELALRSALSLAEEYQAELHLLHVLSAPMFGGPEIAWGPTSTDAVYHKAARRLQTSVPGKAHLSCHVTTAVRWGKPYREILAYANDNAIDLICMGAHGTGNRLQTLFGSNVDRVIRQSPSPILIARPLKPTTFAPLHAHHQSETALFR